MTDPKIPETPSEPFDPFAKMEGMDIALPQEIELNDVPEELLTHEEEIVPAPEPVMFDVMGSTSLKGVVTVGHDTPLKPVPEGVVMASFGDLPHIFDSDSFTMPSVEEPPTPTPGVNPKDALGLAKLDLTAVPPAGLFHLATGMMDGVVKYGLFNWRDNPVLARVYLAAALRHTLQLLDGEDFDPISGVHHAGHAMACFAIYVDAMETGNLVDDRPTKKGPAGDMVRRFTPDKKLSK